ncbi:hypothetical protein [Zavarzinia sp.]|uniref:hypothetical protein n=1 Tax=Zavarzinia sp. TaxID=2027920 RepID=UPI00356330ED
MGSKRKTKHAEGRRQKRASMRNGEKPAGLSKYAQRHDRPGPVEIDDPVHGTGGDRYALEAAG